MPLGIVNHAPVVVIKSDLIITQSDVKTIGSDLIVADALIDTIKSDLIISQSDVKTIGSDLIVLDAIADQILADTGTTLENRQTTIASDLVISQSDIKTAVSDIIVLDAIVDAEVVKTATIASDLVISQSDVKTAVSDIIVLDAIVDAEVVKTATIASDLLIVQSDVKIIDAARLTDKEKSLLGIGVFPGFRDYFNTVANDADPDTTYWSVVENVGTVNVENDTGSPGGQLICFSGGADNNDGIAYTKDKFVISLKDPVTTVHLKARVYFNWAGSSYNCGIGFVENDLAVAEIDELVAVANEVATVVVNNKVPTAYSSDGGTTESTDISAYISDATWFDLEIRITSSDVKYYINDTLRATHSTNLPNSAWQIIIGATSDGSAEYTNVEYIDVWGE